MDDRLASFRFLTMTSQWYRNSKKLCTDANARFSKNLGFHNRTIQFVHDDWIQQIESTLLCTVL